MLWILSCNYKELTCLLSKNSSQEPCWFENSLDVKKTWIKQGNIQMFGEKMLIVYRTGHRKTSSLTAETRASNSKLLGV